MCQKFVICLKALKLGPNCYVTSEIFQKNIPVKLSLLSILYQILVFRRCCGQNYSLIMCRSNCSAPIPPPRASPGKSLFGGVAPVSLSLYFCLAPSYINTLITLFSSAPPFFITHIFPLTPGLPWGGGDGGRTI